MDNAPEILIMDDEPLARLMVRSSLEKSGMLVSEAENCREALEWLRKTAFDAAVFDGRLPDGDGLDLVRRLRREDFGLPVIMLTAEHMVLNENELDELDVPAVLTKPVDTERLIQELGRLFECAETEHEARAGRYVIWPAENGPGPDFEWVAVDFSDWPGGKEIPEPLIEYLQVPRRGTAVIGADMPLWSQLDELTEVNVVLDREELEALSRRLSLPAERAMLMKFD